MGMTSLRAHQLIAILKFGKSDQLTDGCLDMPTEVLGELLSGG